MEQLRQWQTKWTPIYLELLSALQQHGVTGPSLHSYTVRPQALPTCCCSQSIPKVTGQDRYAPHLQDRHAPDSVCQPRMEELQRLSEAQNPMGRHVAHPYRQSWRFRGVYSALLVAVLLGTGIAYLIVRHK